MFYYNNKRRRADFKRIQELIKDELRRENKDPESLKMPDVEESKIEVQEIAS